MLEVIATTVEDAKRIEACGADRIELLSAIAEGGLTPSYGLIKTVVSSVKLPVNVMIRPHAKSFVYTKAELAIMKEDIRIARQLRANGVVLGVLNEHNAICEKSLAALLEPCAGLEVTFHRAIDELADPVNGVKVLAKYSQITTVLTSGGKGHIQDNLTTIREMVENAGKIRVLAGSGLTLENIGQVIAETGAPEFHFGTAVRDNRSAYGAINEQKLKALVALLRRLGR